ncbi:MAG: hypothetical protein ACJ76S_09965 [Solirubrobacteraceae bacterium]
MGMRRLHGTRPLRRRLALSVVALLAGALAAAAPAQATFCNPPRCVVSAGQAPVGGASSSAQTGGTGFSIHRNAVSFAGPVGSGSVALPAAAGDIAAGPDGAAYVTVPRAQTIARIAPNGAANFFKVAYNPRRIIAGPSGLVWFTMQAGRSPVTLGRMTPYGSFYFFQLPVPAFDLRATGANSIVLSGGGRHVDFTPFLGARPIRTRSMPVSPWTFAGYARLKCPVDDYVFCSGRITLRYRGRVIGSAPFSLRVNDAPATRIIINRYGRVVLRRGTIAARATIVQHDQGATTRTSATTYRLFMRGRGS